MSCEICDYQVPALSAYAECGYCRFPVSWLVRIDPPAESLSEINALYRPAPRKERELVLLEKALRK